MKVRIEEIVVGERARKDMGDIQELADSIREVGLLQPIGVDSQKNLVFGERRLKACQLLGWDDIPAGVIDLENPIMGEHAENEIRKDFMPSERVAIAQAIEERIGNRKGINQYTGSEGKQNFAEAQGRRNMDVAAEKAGFGNPETYRQAKHVVESGKPETVEQMDKGEISIHQAYQDTQHARVVGEYPELATFPKTHAIEIARQLKAMPEPLRQEKRREIRQIEETGRQKLDRVDETYRIKKEYTNAIYGAATLNVGDDHLEAWLANTLQTDMQRQMELVEEALEKLEALRNHLKKIFSGPRLVKLGGKNS